MRFLFVLVILSLSYPSFAQEYGCLSKCIARGGLPETCNTECGIVTHGSVNYKAKGVPQQKKPENILKSEVFEECYQKSCLQGLGGLPLDQCIKNCAQPSVFSHPDYKRPKKEGGFKEVNFGCFKICRENGEAMGDCRKLCTD